MTRFSEKLRFPSPSPLYKPSRLLSLKLARLSLSTFNFCKSFARFVASKTLAFFTMENLFPTDDDLWDLDFSSRSRPPQRPRLLDEYDYEYDDSGNEKVYLVPFRWLKDAQNYNDQIGGVLYTVSSNNDADSGILLDLRKLQDSRKGDDAGEGFSAHEYALVGEALWLRVLKWHNDSKPALEDTDDISNSEDLLQDLFPLKIRLSVSWETNSLIVKINQKDNLVDFYKRACSIFCANSELLHIWDFSGQTTEVFMNERIPNDSFGQLGKEILLELQVHGLFLNSVLGGNKRKYDFSGNQLKAGSLGLTGLQNLGNTCFMNSAVQCLAHTSKLVDYFLGDYQIEINYGNPLGMNGELALSFGDLLRKLWAPVSRPVAPRMFKSKVSNFAPQFSGYNQHDSQEFLAFLLDGLHEDLNRVKHKPYIEAKDTEGRPDEEVSEEYWQNHLVRNDSVIVDLCQGQYRSKLVCPTCNKLSVTFDPFMYLSLPLPSTMNRSMTLTVFGTDGITLPSTFTLMVPKSGRLKDLIDALSTACSLRDDETLLMAEIYKNRIFRLLEEPSDSLALIRDEDRLVAYRLPKDDETSSLVVFIHQRLEMLETSGKSSQSRKAFGIPLVTRLSDVSYGSEVCKLFLKLLNPFSMPNEDVFSNGDDENGNSANEDSEMDGGPDSFGGTDGGVGVDTHMVADFNFYLAHMRGDTEGTLLKMNEPVFIPRLTERLEVFVLWSDKMIEKYDTCLLSSLPEVFKTQLLTRRVQESVSLYKCLEAFLKEEPLGPEDMWYCPSCKKPRQARKKLDLWRLPKILVIHLKRFSYSRFLKNKLETFVDFPIDDLDLSNYITHKNIHPSNRYMLYAISNHYGGMGSGHYTAFVSHGEKWYEFDDERVFPVSEVRIKTSAAYVLFYRRVVEE